jgi:hypothetical protein
MVIPQDDVVVEKETADPSTTLRAVEKHFQ